MTLHLGYGLPRKKATSDEVNLFAIVSGYPEIALLSPRDQGCHLLEGGPFFMSSAVTYSIKVSAD